MSNSQYSPASGQTLIEEVTAGSVKTTYIGTCTLAGMNAYDDIATLELEPIRQISQFVETTAGSVKTTEQLFPIDGNGRKSTDFEFVRDDRGTLTYK